MIAEDQVLLRDGLARLLAAEGHTIAAQVGDARELVRVVNAERPDLLIADIRMPPDYTDDGARAALFVRERFPDLAILILSQNLDAALIAGLANGLPRAFGYLLKDRVLDTAVFLDHVRTVGAGGTAIDPMVLAAPVRQDELGRLSEREIEVLGRVASGRSNAGIAHDLTISKRTVEAHLRSIMTKLDLEPGPDDNQRVLAVLRWLSDGVGSHPTQLGRPGR